MPCWSFIHPSARKGYSAKLDFPFLRSTRKFSGSGLFVVA